MTDRLSHPPSPRTRLGWIMAGLLLLTGLLAALWWPRISSAAPWSSDPVTAAWQKAKAAGSYRFDADMTQVTIPSASVTNVGRSSRTEQIHLEGQNNLEAQTLEMRLFSDGSSVLSQDGGMALKVENGKTLVRKGSGDWQEEPSVSADSLAPSGDFMSFLSAVREIKANAPETKGGIHFTRYTFTIDGPKFALYVRDQMEAAMLARGDLAPGMHIDVPAYYRDMTGSGELWIGSNGLPLRQILALQFPEQKEQQVQAQITVNFSSFGKDAVSLAQTNSPWNRWLQATVGWQLPTLSHTLQALMPWLILAVGCTMLALLLYYQRRRAVYNAVTISVVASMLVGPLLTTLTSVRAFDRYTARAQAQEATQAESQALQDTTQLPTEAFNPHIDPLAAAEQAAVDSARSGSGGGAASVSSSDAILGVAAVSAAAAALPVGATSWWRGEKSASDQINTENGVTTGAVTYTAGLVGNAFNFNGSNGYVALPDNFFPFPTTLDLREKLPFSFELWFKTSSGGVILGQQTTTPYVNPVSYVNAIYVGTDGKLRANMFSAGMISAGTVNNNVYHHVAVTFDGTAQKLFLDGAQIATVNTTQQPYADRYRYQLGTGYTAAWAAGNGGWYNFNGAIDEPTLYNRALTAGEVTDIFNAGSSGKTPYPATDNGRDVDSDGLTDFQEARLGTNADNSDTDGDLISDNDEVRGFNFGGKTWYSDPLDADLDSNNDGLADGQERDKDKNGTLDDSDSDGTPDLFDADNDNDGVPDRKDLSPFSKTTATSNGTFTEAAPFKLTLRSLTAGMPTFVDFQLRPKDAQHLWYAQHVLDWPTDSAGQVQDIDNKTFADVAAAQGRVVDASESLGDLKLVPMLELRINGTTTNLPTQDELTPYGISVRNLTADGSSKSVLVPLSIVQDETSGARVAFSGRMRYLPVTTWPTPHEVRLAWVVQSLLDLPCNPQAADASAKGCETDGYIHNVPNPIQVYYDEFTLTGMQVSEERGASMAVIYEDPAVDTNKKDDYALTALSYGLSAAFLTGRDADNNNQRDIDLNEIVRRFDRTQNSGVSETQRWAIANILRVEKKDYAFYDQALMTTAMSETTRILNDKFSGSWQADKSLIPYLLFASEQRVRTINQDGGLSLNAGQMVVDFTPINESTYASLKGQPYCAPDASTPLWQPCTTDAYWDELDRRYKNVGPLPNDVTPDLARARLMATKVYFMGLNQGSTALIKDGQNLVSSIYILTSDTALEKNLRLFGLLVSAGIPALVNQVVMAKFTNNETAVAKALIALADGFDTLRQLPDVLSNPESRESLKNLAKEKFNEFGAKLKSLGATRGAAVKTFGVVAVLTGLSVFLAVGLPRLLANASAPNAQTQAIAIKVVVAGALTVIGIIMPIQDFLAALKSASFANLSLGRALTMRAEHIGSSVKAGVVGAVLGSAVAWGFFIYSVVSNNLTPFSPAFNKALAETVATTIYLILVAAISATIVGAIIMGIISVIDFILTAICELQPGNVLRDAPGLGGACFTIGTAAIKTIAYFLYNFDVMVDFNRDDLVVTGAPVTKLKDPTKGFVAGNSITLSMPVTTTIRHKDPDPANGIYIYPYLWLYSQNNLKSSAFSYSMSIDGSSDLSGVAGGSMDSLWQVEEDHKYILTPMYRAQMAQATSSPVISLTVGLNRPAQSYFNMGYAVPSYECFPVPNIIPPWIPPIIPICYTKFYNGGNSTQLDVIEYDIFPATLDGFMTMGTKTNGRGLAWDAAFNALADSDNDGLLSVDQKGLDPDDTKWDSDNDGLSDTYELTRRQEGIPFSPQACDTDNDGLPDGLEVQLNTSPATRDSDGDGLIDGDEVWHQVFNGSCTATGAWSGGWDIPVGGTGNLTAHISSNPNEADSDGDGLSDLTEKQLVQSTTVAFRVDKYGRPYHPSIFNINPINVVVSVSDADRILRAGQNVSYTTQVIADVPLAPSVVDVSAAGMAQQPAPQTLNFDPASFVASQIVTNVVGITAGSNEGSYLLSSSLRARLGLTSTVIPWTAISQAVQSITSPTKAWRSAAVASRSGTSDPFLLALTNMNEPPTKLNEVRTYALPTSTVVSTLNVTSTMQTQLLGESRPNVACNNAGDCLVVWNETVPSTIPGVTRQSKVMAAMVDATGKLKLRLNTSSFGEPSNAAAVATDGNKFLVVYDISAAEGASTVRTWMGRALINADGTISGLPGANGNTDSTSSLVSGSFIYPISDYKVTWIGDRYRVTRKRINQATIIAYDMNSAGTLVGTANVTLVSDALSVNLSPVFASPHGFAYDPGSGRSMLVYTKIGGNVQGVVYQGASTTALTSRDLGRGDIPQLAFDPNSRNFLYTIRGSSSATAYSLLDNNLNQVGNSSSLVWSGTEPIDDRSLSLVCPAINDTPLVNLRFEDLPGATAFRDSSVNNNHAICSGALHASCPVAGIAGAVDKNNVAGADNQWGATSDYAAAFSRTAASTSSLALSKPITLTQFTLAFWVKMPTNAAGTGDTLFHTLNNWPTTAADDLQVYTGNGLLYVKVGQEIGGLVLAPRVDDNQWHYVVITRVPTTSTTAKHINIYVDGSTTPGYQTGTAGTGVTIANKTLRMGGVDGILDFNGALDGVQLYSVALDAARVKALYDRTFNPACVVTIPRSTTNSWSRLQLAPQETRGGKITSSGSISVTIDKTRPDVSFTSVRNGLFVQGAPPAAPSKTILVGGNASDTGSYISQVSLFVGSTAQTVSGTDTWVSPIQVNEGQYQLTIRSTDAADNVSVAYSLFIYADGTAPQITTNSLANPTRLSTTNATGKWVVNLSGNVSDPRISVFNSTTPGSGVASLEVALEDSAGLVPGTNWQRATIGGKGLPAGAWSIAYLLPNDVKNPTDLYTVTLRAVDNVGNRSQTTTSLRVDSNGPDSQLTATDVSSGAFTNTISSTVTIGGVISDTGGSTLQSIHVALTPITQVLVVSDTLVKLDFSDGLGYLVNGAANGKDAYCPLGSNCPVVGAGISSRNDDRSLSFASTITNEVLMLDAAVKNSFTSAYWVKPTANVNNSIIMVDQGANAANGWTMSFDQGRAAFLVNTGEYLVSPNRIDDGQWHFVVGVRDVANSTMKLYVDGALVASRAVTANALTAFNNLRIGSDRSNNRRFTGLFDSLRILNRALTLYEIQALQAETTRQWFTQSIATGYTTATWQLALPTGMEGIYQIDLAGQDLLGNVRSNNYAWRGVIDMLAPRLTFTATATGASYLDSATNTQRYEIRYVCRAEDWSLKEDSFDCPGNASQPPERTFNNDPILQAQFPELTLLTTLVNSYTVWAESATPTGTLTACDLTDHCATVDVQATAASTAASQMLSAASVNTVSLTPKAVVVNPTDNSTVDGSDGNVEVTIAAEAAKTLKDVTLLVDGEIVATFPYARIDKLQSALSTVNLNLSDGAHMLAAYASDWTGAVQSVMSSVTVLVNNKTTQLTIDGGLGVSRTWQLGSGILVLEGNVSNEENLAAVQVRVGDQNYVDAQFGDGRWGVAYPVTDPEGKTLAISVRAIDKAGQVTQIGDGLATDFSTANPPETTINNAPAANSDSTSASFSFSGDQGAAAFKCQLDEGAYSLCASPVSYNDLSNGSHSFRVKAINGQGFEDLSPASYTWTINGAGQLVEIESAPAATSTSRSARFEFEAAGEDEDEQAHCSLDGSAFSACTSPVTYNNLADGTHTFQVRVKGNPASKVSWNVQNVAPVASSMVVTTAQNTKLPVTLKASDESALKYVIVGKPANGTLSGTGANLVYQPGTDFFGVDSFSFKADDGDATSNLATVTINVTPQAGQNGLQRDGFVVFGSEGVILRENVKVMSGDIAASNSSQGPWLGDGAEVSIGNGVSFADAKSKVLGDTVFVGQGTALANANYNELRGPGTVKGNKVTPQALPLLNRFVAMPGIGVGKQNVDVAANAKVTLQAGNYLSLNVAKGGEVSFSGGVYSFKEWNVAENSRLYFAAASEVRISGRAIVGEHGYVGPAPSSAVSAKQIVIYVAGVNANSAVLGGLGAKAATFGPYATLAANVVVPNGTLLIRERSKAVGSFVGRWVSVGKFSELTLANRFNSSTVEGRVDGYVNLTLDDATGINATAALSPNVNDELLSEEGANEENLDAVKKVFLPVISSGTVGQSDSESVESNPVDVAPESNTPSEEEQKNMVFLPAVSR